jgi:hypothetical protein
LEYGGGIFLSANGMHQTLWTGSNFQPADHVPVQHTGPLGGNQTHDLRFTILDLDRSASGTNYIEAEEELDEVEGEASIEHVNQRKNPVILEDYQVTLHLPKPIF